MGLDNFAVVVHKRFCEGKYREFRAHCRIVRDEFLDKGTVCIDQTVRSAIGIPYKNMKDREDLKKIRVKIFPLKLNLIYRIKYKLSSFLGRRYLFLRVVKANVPDLEKNFMRIPLDAINVLGTKNGRKVVLENLVYKEGIFIVKSISIHAYDLSDSYIEKRKSIKMEPRCSNIELENSSDNRYVNPEEVLNIDPDIWQIFLESYHKDKLGILEKENLGSVKARRDMLDLFLNEFVNFGLSLLLAFFALNEILPSDISYPLPKGFLVIFLSVILSIFLVLTKIRSEIK